MMKWSWYGSEGCGGCCVAVVAVVVYVFSRLRWQIRVGLAQGRLLLQIHVTKYPRIVKEHEGGWYVALKCGYDVYQKIYSFWQWYVCCCCCSCYCRDVPSPINLVQCDHSHRIPLLPHHHRRHHRHNLHHHDRYLDIPPSQHHHLRPLVGTYVCV